MAGNETTGATGTGAGATAPGGPGILAGLRVVEVSAGLAAPVTAMLLAEQGAEVVRVIDLRRPPADPVLEAILSRGKIEAPLDLSNPADREALARLAARCDVLVDDLPPGTLRSLGVDVEALRAGPTPGLVNASIPAFGEGDPRNRPPGHDAVAATAGCLYEKPLGPPAFHDLPVPSVMAGLFAASGVMGALVARLRTGRGQQVSASLYHTTLFSQILQILMKTGIPRGFLPLKMIGTPFMRSWACRDGRWVYLHITLPAHNARILDVLDANGHGADVAALRSVLSPETMRDPSQVKSIPEARRIRTIYERIFLQRTADEWEALLGRELCCIKVRTVQEWMRDSVDAGMTDACVLEDPVFGPLTVPGPGAATVEHPPLLRPRQVDPAALAGLQARWDAEPSAASATPREPGVELAHPLQGIRVADLSRIIAGPCAARILAELGADVVSIMTPTGLDWALSFHLLFNAGKRSVTIDSSDEAGKRTLWAVLDSLKPDVFLQNYRHMDVAKAVGVDPDSVRARFPGVVYTHLNAYGEHGAWKDRPGFEQIVQAVSGIQVTYGLRGGKPKLLPTPVIDIGSGLAGALATLLGLYHRMRTGEGVVATTHLTWLALMLQVQGVAEAQREACLQEADRRGHATDFDPGRLPVAGIVKTWDGTACLSGSRNDVGRFLQAVGMLDGRGALPPDPLAAAGGLRWRPLRLWQERLAAAGLSDRVALVPVVRAASLVGPGPREDPDPLPAVGKRDYPGCPVPLTFVRTPLRFSGTPVKDVAPPPVRGASTAEVLAGAGIAVPAGQGQIPYPGNKPVLAWALDLVRWGWFAWRSGNI